MSINRSKAYLILAIICPIAFSKNIKTQDPIDIYFNRTIQKFDNKEVIVYEPVTKILGNLNEIFPDEVFLVISPSCHYSLQFPKHAINGAFYPIPTTCIKQSSFGESGYIIRFPTIPKELVRAADKQLEKSRVIQGMSLSCVQSATSNLTKHTGVNTKYFCPKIHSSKTLTDIINGGFVDADGNQIEIQIIKGSKESEDLQDYHTSFILPDLIYTASSLGLMYFTYLKGLQLIRISADKCRVILKNIKSR